MSALPVTAAGLRDLLGRLAETGTEPVAVQARFQPTWTATRTGYVELGSHDDAHRAIDALQPDPDQVTYWPGVYADHWIVRTGDGRDCWDVSCPKEDQ